jgi:hypothetical protein
MKPIHLSIIVVAVLSATGARANKPTPPPGEQVDVTSSQVGRNGPAKSAVQATWALEPHDHAKTHIGTSKIESSVGLPVDRRGTSEGNSATNLLLSFEARTKAEQKARDQRREGAEPAVIAALGLGSVSAIKRRRRSS